MYVTKEDSIILRSNEIRTMRAEYEEKFKEKFICFNYADFRGSKDKAAAQEYKEIMQKALQADKPHHIRTKQYDDADLFDD